MALTRELQIHKDSRQLLSAVDTSVINMPRDRKFNLGNKMFNLAVDIPELIGHANRQNGQARKDTLNIVLEKLGHLDFLTEYCIERRYIPLRQCALIAQYLDKVAKQATGWRNYVKR